MGQILKLTGEEYGDARGRASSVMSGSRKKRSKIGLQRVSEVAGYLTLGIFFGESSKVYLQ
jgi:hypothetical protein